MEKPTFDPGLTQKYTGALRRTINKDGTFNVHRRGATWRDANAYLYLINVPWPAFLGIIFAAYLAVNTLFALVYYSLGPNQLQGVWLRGDLQPTRLFSGAWRGSTSLAQGKL